MALTAILGRLRPFVAKLRKTNPALFYFLVKLAKRYMGRTFGVYPRPLGNEIEAVAEILRGSQWNMAYGRGLAHERLEAKFAETVGTSHAVAVASGGMAIQMSLRALGLMPGDEAIHQVDTCSATAMAVMNAGVTPVFADISEKTFMMDSADIESRIGSQTRALIMTHMWGNPENVCELRDLARRRNLILIEDACLALGAVAAGKPAGSWGDVAVFSFGCIKPIQTGEGGMIATNDEALARELRSLRHWGDRTIEYGVRDATKLSWNGRMSEILAGVAYEQLRGYPAHLRELRSAVAEFSRVLEDIPGLSIVLGASDDIASSAFTQVVLRVEVAKSLRSKSELMAGLADSGVANWHANFELINGLTFFKSGDWQDWIPKGDIDRVKFNNSGRFPVAERIFAQQGFGLGKSNFLSSSNRKHLEAVLRSITQRDNY